MDHEVGHIIDILNCSNSMSYDKFKKIKYQNFKQEKDHFEEPLELRANKKAIKFE